MHEFCPNCGDPIEQDEVFCDKCGTRLISDMKPSNEQIYQGQNNYQGNGMPPQNNYAKPNAYNPAQQNPPQIIPNQQYPPTYGKQKKKNLGKTIYFIGLGIFIVCVLVVGLAILFGGEDDPNQGTISNNIPNSSNTPNTPNTQNDNKPASGKALAAWTANLNSLANYDAAKKTIYVDYTVTLKNLGTGRADSVKVYLDPEQKDENGQYLGIQPKTIVDTSGAIILINSGESRELKTRFFYDNIEPAGATQQILQEIANRYIKLPVLVEWQENGKTYTEKLIAK